MNTKQRSILGALAIMAAAMPAAASPTQLAIITSPQTLSVGACSALTTVQSQDPSGVPTNVGVGFFPDAARTTLSPIISITAGTNSSSFYFKAFTSGSPNIRAFNAALSPANQAETINGGTPSKLAFITPPQTLSAGICS